MDHFVGLDVSVKETSVCIVNDSGKIVREVKVASEPEVLLPVLKNPGYQFKLIGLEAGPLSQWLYSALAEAELPVVCVETRPLAPIVANAIDRLDNVQLAVSPETRIASGAREDFARAAASRSRRQWGQASLCLSANPEITARQQRPEFDVSCAPDIPRTAGMPPPPASTDGHFPPRP
jgi:transposase